jgi:SAM-dependent methyltransferase
MTADDKELLVLSAPLARRMAPRLCRKDPITGEDCSWYHGLWHDLRLLGLAAAPDQQATFFRDAFARVAGRSLRVLISGSADYSILAHVHAGCVRHQVAAKITVLDTCETPLFFARWYAERAGFQVETVQADIFSYTSETAFDAICSHGFLSQFPPSQRLELVHQWFRLLAPAGTVLLVNRVRPGPAGTETKFSEAQARQFCDSVAEKLRRIGSADRSEIAAILARAEAYARRLVGYALTENELTTLFDSDGFHIDHTEILTSPAQDGLVAPAVPGGANHACLVATRI